MCCYLCCVPLCPTSCPIFQLKLCGRASMISSLKPESGIFETAIDADDTCFFLAAKTKTHPSAVLTHEAAGKKKTIPRYLKTRGKLFICQHLANITKHLRFPRWRLATRIACGPPHFHSSPPQNPSPSAQKPTQARLVPIGRFIDRTFSWGKINTQEKKQPKKLHLPAVAWFTWSWVRLPPRPLPWRPSTWLCRHSRRGSNTGGSAGTGDRGRG